jgi:hypothetical protein
MEAISLLVKLCQFSSNLYRYHYEIEPKRFILISQATMDD